ncbi:hypothetical protein RZS08_28965, partial [Arthrospira platensis SPKY1]|nr:hypothetical protein [Arthrospira platensis SPKY1]
FGKIQFIPIRKTGPNTFERLVEFTLDIQQKPATPPMVQRGGGPTYNSVLRDGAIYKIGVSRTGVHKIDYNFLVDQLGIAAASINPARIQLFGNGGGMLPEAVSDSRPDDLIENPILVVDGGDGKFDPGDYILFFAQGPSIWKRDESSET